MDNPLTDSERQVAKRIGQDAMIMGWDKAISKQAKELKTPAFTLRNILDKAATYNDKADPSGRIPELQDYKTEKRERSVRASGFATRVATKY